jgi:hypothetical protein
MIESDGAIRPVLEYRRFHRFAIAVNRSPFSATMYWMWTGDDARIADGREAVKRADFRGLMNTISGMETAEPDDSPGAR